MNKTTILEKTRTHLKELFTGEGSGHDWWHIWRVRNTALQICQQEGGDPFIVELAALLHDIADWKFANGDDTVGPRVAKEWLETVGADTETVTHICEIIAGLSYKGSGVDTTMKTIEGKITQDADRLDAIGAIGIARAFAYGGHANREMYNPGISPMQHQSFTDYKTKQTTTLNHFYEKLLLLKDRMQTETGKRLAQARHQYMEAFLEQFYAEWDGKA